MYIASSKAPKIRPISVLNLCCFARGHYLTEMLISSSFTSQFCPCHGNCCRHNSDSENEKYTKPKIPASSGILCKLYPKMSRMKVWTLYRYWAHFLRFQAQLRISHPPTTRKSLENLFNPLQPISLRNACPSISRSHWVIVFFRFPYHFCTQSQHLRCTGTS